MRNKKLHNKILEGEHLKQDFKYAVNDSKKIARSIAAFANSLGGSLLIGVKDNGNIVGVSSEEEYYMIEAAAKMYCIPPVAFNVIEWKSEKKSVLEIIIPKSEDKPHKAPNKDGKYMVYIRVDDQNLLANKILLEYWKAVKKNKDHILTFNKPEKFILEYLTEYRSITISKFQKGAKISRFKAERILINLLCMRVIRINITEKSTTYSLIDANKQINN